MENFIHIPSSIYLTQHTISYVELIGKVQPFKDRYIFFIDLDVSFVYTGIHAVAEP